jgi:hypothetical protein
MRRVLVPVLASPLLLVFFIGLAITAVGAVTTLCFGTAYCYACGPDSKAAILVASLQECLKEDA